MFESDNSSVNNSVSNSVNNAALEQVVYVVNKSIEKYRKSIKKDIKILKKAKKIFRKSRNFDPGVIRKIDSLIEELKEDLE